MKGIKSVILFIIGFLFVGCGSMYHYNVTPTPIKQGTTKYTLNSVTLKLGHGHGRNLQNTTFKDENELRISFQEFIVDALKEKQLYAEDGYKIDVEMNYTRKYNYGGNALNKPEFYYTVKVMDSDNRVIASYSIPRSTTKYSYAKDMAVNMQIGLFKWKAEEEPQDIELISKTLVRELSEMGE